MINSILSRVFIVGCPRSGTTLIQSLINAHPLVFSFPESHFFPNIISKNRMNRVLGIASGNAEKNAMTFFKTFENHNVQNEIRIKSNRVKSYAEYFVSFLDLVAIDSEKRIWLEKTPQHLYYIRPIEKYIKNSKFIHIVRNGEDVIASLYDVTHKYPKIWGGSRTIDQCIKRWIEDIEITSKHFSRQNHITIKYEELVEYPKKIIQRVCDFIDVKFNKEMLEEYRIKVNELLIKGETWKQGVKGSIENNNGEKFLSVFNYQERKYVRKRLASSASLAFYQNLKYDKLIAA